MGLWRYIGAVSLGGLQLANALTGGSASETPSARAAQARQHGSKFAAGECRVLNVLDFHQEREGEDHCAKAARHLEERRQKALAAAQGGSHE